jgi:hypothetical protein
MVTWHRCFCSCGYAAGWQTDHSKSCEDRAGAQVILPLCKRSDGTWQNHKLAEVSKSRNRLA